MGKSVSRVISDHRQPVATPKSLILDRETYDFPSTADMMFPDTVARSQLNSKLSLFHIGSDRPDVQPHDREFAARGKDAVEDSHQQGISLAQHNLTVRRLPCRVLETGIYISPV